MGALCALSFGVADFLASRSSRRIGAASALTGMLLVSTLALTAAAGIAGRIALLHGPGAWLAGLHGVTMAGALLLFFRAMQLGPVTVAAPIVAAHPIFVITFALAMGSQPSGLQLAAMLGTIAGLVIVSAVGGKAGGSSFKGATFSALAASLVYAAAIVSAQEAMRHSDPLLVLWLGRLFGLLLLAAVFAAGRRRPELPRAWWPFFCVHGTLDSGGLLFLLLGSSGELNEITAVVDSTFSMVTVVLAWVILKERITWPQLTGILLIVGCVAVLAYSV